MNFNGCNSFEDLMRRCGCYGNQGSGNEERFNFGCNDIPGGFQDLNPELFVILGSVFGAAIAGELPSNVQSSVGNLFELIGQTIITFNAQQEYQEAGPGGFYSPRNKNVSNPFCAKGDSESSESESENMNNSNSSQGEIDELKDTIKELVNEIQKLKCEIEHIKREL